MRAGSALASSPRPLPKDGDGWVVPARRFWSAVAPRHAGTASSALFVTAEEDAPVPSRVTVGAVLSTTRGLREVGCDFGVVRVTAASVVNEASRLGTSERMSAMADRHHVRIEYCVPLRGTPQRRRSGGADSRGVGRQPQCGGGGDRSRRDLRRPRRRRPRFHEVDARALPRSGRRRPPRAREARRLSAVRQRPPRHLGRRTETRLCRVGVPPRQQAGHRV